MPAGRGAAWGRIGVVATGLLAWLGLATSAAAAGYTLDDDILGFVAGTATVDILAVDDLSGTDLTLDGSVAEASSQDWFVVELVITAGSLTSIGISNVGSLAVGVGHFDDGAGAPSSGLVSPDPDDSPEAFFAGGLSGASDRLIATYDLGDLPGPGVFPVVPPGTVSFSLNDGSNFFSTQGTAVEIQAPEPGLFLLMGSAVLGPVVARRRAASRRRVEGGS